MFWQEQEHPCGFCCISRKSQLSCSHRRSTSTATPAPHRAPWFPRCAWLPFCTYQALRKNEINQPSSKGWHLGGNPQLLGQPGEVQASGAGQPLTSAPLDPGAPALPGVPRAPWVHWDTKQGPASALGSGAGAGLLLLPEGPRCHLCLSTLCLRPHEAHTSPAGPAFPVHPPLLRFLGARSIP